MGNAIASLGLEKVLVGQNQVTLKGRQLFLNDVAIQPEELDFSPAASSLILSIASTSSYKSPQKMPAVPRYVIEVDNEESLVMEFRFKGPRESRPLHVFGTLYTETLGKVQENGWETHSFQLAADDAWIWNISETFGESLSRVRFLKVHLAVCSTHRNLTDLKFQLDAEKIAKIAFVLDSWKLSSAQKKQSVPNQTIEMSALKGSGNSIERSEETPPENLEAAIEIFQGGIKNLCTSIENTIQRLSRLVQAFRSAIELYPDLLQFLSKLPGGESASKKMKQSKDVSIVFCEDISNYLVLPLTEVLETRLLPFLQQRWEEFAGETKEFYSFQVIYTVNMALGKIPIPQARPGGSKKERARYKVSGKETRVRAEKASCLESPSILTLIG